MKIKFYIPPIIPILGKLYNIKFDSETGNCGYIDYNNDSEDDIGTISISSHIKSLKLIKETILHEVIHAITEKIGLAQGVPHSILEIISESIAKEINKLVDWKFIFPCKKRGRSARPKRKAKSQGKRSSKSHCS